MKKAIRIAAVCTGVVASVAVLAAMAGLFCPERVEGSAAVVIHKPQEEVFALISNHERLLREVHSPQIRFIQEGSQRRWRIEGAPGFALQEDIAYEPPHRFVSRMYDESGHQLGEWDIRVQPVRGSTGSGAGGKAPMPTEASIVSVDMHFSFSNPYIRLFATLMDASAEEQKSLIQIKEFIEKQ